MSEKIIRKIDRYFYVRIPAEMRRKLNWHTETKITVWVEKNKIFLRETVPTDNKNLKFNFKFDLSKINDQLSWFVPKCWRWYYGFKVGDKSEFDYASEEVIVLTPLKCIKHPEPIYKKLIKGRLYIPTDILRMVRIEPIGGINIKTEEDKILITPEKIGSAKYFVAGTGSLHIPIKIRREINICPNATLELFIENGAIVLKKYRDYDKFAILSKKTIDDMDEKAMAYFEKHKTNHKKIKREVRL